MSLMTLTVPHCDLSVIFMAMSFTASKLSEIQHQYQKPFTACNVHVHQANYLCVLTNLEI